MSSRRAIVLGAGIQGVLVALMLANRGIHVTLLEQRRNLMRGASLNYEGRVHLGLIYAMDQTFHTSARLLQDALHFGPVLERLVGAALPWESLRSTPSSYFIHRDSLLTAGSSAAFYHRIEREVLGLLQDEQLHYLGRRPSWVAREITTPPEFRSGFVQAAFETIEACIDQPTLSPILERAVVSHPRIDLRHRHRVEEVEAAANGWTVACRVGDTPTLLSAELVFNCLWESRGLFDRRIGLEDPGRPSLRLKYGLLIDRDVILERLGSFALVHGAFGSVVTYPDSRMTFLSWYPACLDGILPLQALPHDWVEACRRPAPRELAQRLWHENLLGFRELLPELGAPALRMAKAGVIVADGLRDIDDRRSDFHRRDEPPFRQIEGYFSIATSKYTSAPRNTALLESALFD